MFQTKFPEYFCGINYLIKCNYALKLETKVVITRNTNAIIFTRKDNAIIFITISYFFFESNGESNSWKYKNISN